MLPGPQTLAQTMAVHRGSFRFLASIALAPWSQGIGALDLLVSVLPTGRPAPLPTAIKAGGITLSGSFPLSAPNAALGWCRWPVERPAAKTAP
jgi:hypothetical protein